ncbi:MAG: hypothetical protein KAT16_06250 [Candidatus Heimdallarchaeota archaeon]|nr:hypothetical protein [Candidatus Heimdallarchaeota archaeon]
MVRYVIQTTLILSVIMLTLGISPTIPTEMMNPNVVAAQSESPLISIQQVNLEVEKDGEFYILEELAIDDPTTADQSRIPRFLNKSTIRVNATYSTIIGNFEEIVIHFFAVEVYLSITGENDNFTVEAGNSAYNYLPPEELVLPPNSSKSEIVEIPSLILPSFGNFKFVFHVQYHVMGENQLAKDTYFAQNMSFELVETLPEPPYAILIVFYILAFVLIAFVILGIYGSRKYKDLDL